MVLDSERNPAINNELLLTTPKLKKQGMSRKSILLEKEDNFRCCSQTNTEPVILVIS